MTVWLKQGVMGRLSHQAQKGQGRMIRLYRRKKLDFYITSLAEGNHMGGSFHYIDEAWDWKRYGVLIDEVKKALGPDFDVTENKKLDIFHAEYDPKGEGRRN